MYDPDNTLPERLNPGMVESLPLDAIDEQYVFSMISEHHSLTGSTAAERILSDWQNAKKSLVKVISPAYRRVLELQQERDGNAVQAAKNTKEAIHG